MYPFKSVNFNDQLDDIISNSHNSNNLTNESTSLATLTTADSTTLRNPRRKDVLMECYSDSMHLLASTAALMPEMSILNDNKTMLSFSTPHIEPTNMLPTARYNAPQHSNHDRKSPSSKSSTVFIDSQQIPTKQVILPFPNVHETRYPCTSFTSNATDIQRNPVTSGINGQLLKSADEFSSFKFSHTGLQEKKNMKGKTLLVHPRYRKTTTSFTYALIREMVPCYLNEEDRVGKRRSLPIGYAGLACQYCHDQCSTGRFFPSNIKTMSDTSKSLNIFYNHMLKCHLCPAHIKNELKRMRLYHDLERGSLMHGSQRAFFNRIWNHLHQPPIDKEPRSLPSQALKSISLPILPNILKNEKYNLQETTHQNVPILSHNFSIAPHWSTSCLQATKNNIVKPRLKIN